MKRLIGAFILLTLINPFVFASQPIIKVYPSNYRVDDSLHDEVSGYDFYLFHTGDNLNKKLIIHDQNKNKWFRIAGRGNIWLSKKCDSCFPIITNYINNHYFSYYYDAANHTLLEGNQYLKSDNGKAGYLIEIDWKDGMNYQILFKNFVNGDIRLLYETRRTHRIYWTKDNQLLINRYSETAKENEIVLYSPDKKAYQKVVFGSIYKFSPEHNLILFVKNEQLRRQWIYDLSTNQERLAKDQEEIDKWFPSSYTRSSGAKVPEPPEDLDIDSLETITPTFGAINEHKLIFDDQEIPIFFTFKKEGKTFIPVRPLIETVNIQAKYSRDGNHLISYKNSLQLNSENSTEFNDRLFVTSDVLESIGIPSFSIQPNQESIQ